MSNQGDIFKSTSLGLPILVGGGFIRKAVVQDEEWLEGELVADPEAVVRELQSVSRADVFSFARPLPHCDAKFRFHAEWDNVAIARVDKFSAWWEALPQETRKNVRRSQRRGVTVGRMKFDAQMAQGISRIYNETPIRQGRKFWHYGKALAQVQAENGTYPDRSEFIGACFGGELIGFIKFVMVNNLARIMQIVCLEAHTDKRPTNALLAKAVELCCEKGASHLIYGKYVYGRKENSPVTEFKRRNGFERLVYPRYYVPVTRKGALGIGLGLHRNLAQVLPEPITDWFLSVRTALYRRKFSPVPRLPKPGGAGQEPPEEQPPTSA